MLLISVVPLSASGELLLLAVWIPAAIFLWKLTHAIFSYKCEENSPVVHLPKGSWLGKHPGGRWERREERECCFCGSHIFTQPESDLTVCLFWDTVIMWPTPVFPNPSSPCSFPILTLTTRHCLSSAVDGRRCVLFRDTHSDVLRTCMEELWECSAERQRRLTKSRV